MGRGSNEELYFETIGRYTNDEIMTFTRLFGELVGIYDKATTLKDWIDPLGEYYECLASNYKKSNFGQFFTPKAVCTLMAQLIINRDEWGKTVNEPCAGSGRLVLASNQAAEGNYFVCQDLDPICCKMTAINLCFHKIRGEVHCMDTLRMTEPRFSYAVNYELWKHDTINILQIKPS